jgi:hypothetical protein
MLHARGPLLSVDAGERTARRVDVDGALAAYVGGRGLNTRLLAGRAPTRSARRTGCTSRPGRSSSRR